jgi:hypothetical protein
MKFSNPFLGMRTQKFTRSLTLFGYYFFEKSGSSISGIFCFTEELNRTFICFLFIGSRISETYNAIDHLLKILTSFSVHQVIKYHLDPHAFSKLSCSVSSFCMAHFMCKCTCKFCLIVPVF